MTPREEFRTGMLKNAADCGAKSASVSARFTRLAWWVLAVVYVEIALSFATESWAWALAAAIVLPQAISNQKCAREYRGLYLGLREKILDDMNTTLREVDEMP